MNKTILLTLLVAVLLASSFVTATLSQDDFKKMKIKELRSFLSDRGLDCPGCQEKSDFVRVAFNNRDKQPIASSKRREVPAGKFWDVWSHTAEQLCVEGAATRGYDASKEPFATICHNIRTASESYLMQHSKRIAQRLKKTPEHMLKTSYRDVYYDAGLRIFQKLVNHCLVSPSNQKTCESYGEVQTIFEGTEAADYKSWLTNVGIENTNPLYEIIEENEDL